MRNMLSLGLVALVLVLVQPARAAGTQAVTMSGGFQAEAHREIATGPDRKAMVYSVLGALTLSIGGTPRAFSAECLGFDEQGGSGGTIGTGRCLWKDAAGDSLFLAIATGGDRNTYTVTGGTGKWLGAQGELSTRFTYLPAPEGLFLLSETGSGRLSAPKQ